MTVKTVNLSEVHEKYKGGGFYAQEDIRPLFADVLATGIGHEARAQEWEKRADALLARNRELEADNARLARERGNLRAEMGRCRAALAEADIGDVDEIADGIRAIMARGLRNGQIVVEALGKDSNLKEEQEHEEAARVAADTARVRAERDEWQASAVRAAKHLLAAARIGLKLKAERDAARDLASKAHALTEKACNVAEQAAADNDRLLKLADDMEVTNGMALDSAKYFSGRLRAVKRERDGWRARAEEAQQVLEEVRVWPARDEGDAGLSPEQDGSEPAEDCPAEEGEDIPYDAPPVGGSEEREAAILREAFAAPESPGVEVNERGGKQSALPCRLDLLPARAVVRIGEVLKVGAENYGIDNWRAITVQEHLNHLLTHAYQWLGGSDTGEDHLAHAACRALMALEISLCGVEDHSEEHQEKAA